MNLTQLTDSQLRDKLDHLCTVYLASCELDHDFEHLEFAMDSHFHECKRRGIIDVG